MKAATGITEDNKLEELLHIADYDIRTAIIMALGNIEVGKAREVIKKHEGVVRSALRELLGENEPVLYRIGIG